MSYIDVYDNKKEVVVWERDAEEKLHTKVYHSDEFHYLFIPDNTGKSEYKNIYGTPMKKVFFENRWKMREYAEGRKGVCESDVQPTYKTLLDHYRNCEIGAPYNVMLFDIEVDFDLEDGMGYPSPKNPFGEINAISCFDCSQSKYIMFLFDIHKGTVNLKDDEHPVDMVWCQSERDMLNRFCRYIDHIDIFSAWNGQMFDIPYIMERLFHHFNDKALSMLCRNGFNAKKRSFVNEYKEDVWEWNLVGRTHLDMMQLFKKFHPGEKKSFSLDAVCEEELGVKKIEYDDDLGKLYKENPQKFFEYSLHDSRLLKYLDDKQKVIDLAMMMARDMCALPKDVTGSVNIINMALMKFCRKDGNIVLPDIKEIEKEEFDGALVYDTIPGRHGWVYTIDLTALYPASIMLVGMSKENLLMQCSNGYEDYIKIMTKSDETISVWIEDEEDYIDISARDLELIIRDSGYTISGHGTIFDGSMGILARFTQEGFDQRTHYKNLMKETDEEDLRNRYDLYQKVMKIRNNSIYGILSQPAFRFADIRISASTTKTGQLISKWQAYKANQLTEDAKGI